MFYCLVQCRDNGGSCVYTVLYTNHSYSQHETLKLTLPLQQKAVIQFTNVYGYISKLAQFLSGVRIQEFKNKGKVYVVSPQNVRGRLQKCPLLCMGVQTWFCEGDRKKSCSHTRVSVERASTVITFRFLLHLTS